MDLLQLRYFRALAERQHLRKTAEELLISAPSLSATIGRLEQELGVRLFDRIGRKIKLNRYGQIYLKHVQNVFNTLENARNEITDAQNHEYSKLFIAVTSPTIYHKTFEDFLKRYPNISTSYTSIKLSDWLSSDSLSSYNFILTSPMDITGSNWEYDLLCEDDSPCLAVYKDHPFAQKNGVYLAEAKNELFVALSQGHSLRKYFDMLCTVSGFKPKIVVECDYIMRGKLISERYGITLTTVSGMLSQSQSWDAENTRFVKILEPGIKRPQGILWNKSKYMTQAALIFRDFIVNYYKTHPFGL